MNGREDAGLQSMEFLKTADVCRVLRRDRTTIYDYIKRGLLRPRKVGGQYLWTHRDLLEFVGDR